MLPNFNLMAGKKKKCHCCIFKAGIDFTTMVHLLCYTSVIQLICNAIMVLTLATEK